MSDDSLVLDARDGGIIHSSYDISATGEYSYGLFEENMGKIVISGNIAVEGDSSAGAVLYDHSAADITGNITVTGDYGGIGLHLDYINTADVVGNVSVYGAGAVGVDTINESIVSIDGGVLVSGDGSTGAFATERSSVSISKGLSLYGSDADGARASNGSSISIGGDVRVIGDSSGGMLADEGGTLKTGGSVYVSGDSSYGAQAWEKNSVINIGGGVYVSGDNSYGAQTWSRGVVNISGDIAVSGEGNHGAYAWTYSKINIDGAVNISGDWSIAAKVDEGSRIYVGDGVYAFGENVYGVEAGNFSQANINGGVLVSGDYSTAIHAWHHNTAVTVRGDVSAQGTNAVAACAWDSAVIDITGNVYASGEAVTGAFARGHETVINISGDIVAEGENSYGAHAWQDAVTININGGIDISGDNSTAAFAEETSVINIRNGVVTSSGADNTTMLVQYGGLISLDNTIARTDGGIFVKTEDFGSIYAENGSSMFGDVVNLNDYYEDETLNLTLSGASSLSGSINDDGAEAMTNAILADSLSTWYVTGDSTIKGTLENNGIVDYRNAEDFKIVTVNTLGELGAGGGLFAMKADVAKETADLLKVTGASSGSYLIEVDNDGSARTSGSEITLLVETADRNSDFALTHLVEKGAWTYQLRHNTTNFEAGAGWQLVANDISDPGSAAINTYRASYMLNYAETTLIQRMGDLRASPELRGVWARIYGGEFEAKDRGVGGAKAFEMNYGGVHIGYDRKLEIGWNGDFYFGVTAGYSAGDLDLHSGGDSDVKSYMVGMYGTFIHQNGFYLDAVLKYRWKESDLGTYDSTGDYVTSNSINTGGFGWSIEFGQRISFSAKPKDGWYAEPQVQLRYQRQGEGHYELSNGLRIGADGVTSVIGRLGVLVGYEKNDRNYYVKAFRLKEFDGKLNVWTHDHDYLTTESLGGSWWVYGLGLTSKINDRNYLYCDIERTAGSSDFQQKWRLNAGWRHEI